MTAKEEIVKLMERLPDDATIEDAIESLIVLYKVQQGLEQLDKGEGIPHEKPRGGYVSGFSNLVTGKSGRSRTDHPGLGSGIGSGG